MQQTKKEASFTIDGYEITATFTESVNIPVMENIKQILISSFLENERGIKDGNRIFANHSRNSDNNCGGTLYAP